MAYLSCMIVEDRPTELSCVEKNRERGYVVHTYTVLNVTL